MEFDLLGLAAQGMARERTMLELAARNVAAAQASTPEHEYHRLVADFVDNADFSDDLEPHVHETNEPVDALAEMVSMLDAQRSYEADASIFDVGKRIAERTMDLGRS
ncbi:MAG: flagellar basal body rod C-terminal domain-containing protein [Vulcanimicrobiaceae bacterium]